MPMPPIGSRIAQWMGASKAPGAVPAANAHGPSAVSDLRPQSEGKPGSDAPEHLRDSQPGGAKKMLMLEKMSAVGNVVGMGASLSPLLPSHKGDKNAQSNPPDVDMGDYYQAKIAVAVGPPPINW